MKGPLLALLSTAPAHGYELKLGFEQLFGDGMPPLNVGQVYATLQRLERDGLVVATAVAGDARGKKVYALSSAGRRQLDEWVEEIAPADLKDEFFVKLVFAELGGLADPVQLIKRQRLAYLRALRGIEEQLGAQRPGGAVVPRLLLEGSALHIEADLKWLDLCEERLRGQGDAI